MQKTSREKAGSLPVTQTATTIGQGDARVTLSQTLADPARAIFVLILAGILALAIAGLPLAIVGSFYPIPVAALSIALWVPLTVMAWRLTSSSKHISTLASWLVVGVAAAFAFFTMSNSGEHVLTNRDPGVYVITGKWLAAHGNLVYDNGLPADVASSLTHPNSWSSQGIYAQGPGTGVFQFQHLTGVVLAASHWVGGDWLLYRIMGAVAAASLLGLFLVSRRIAGQIFGIIPVVVAAVHPAFIHFAKDVYSEWFAMTFAMAAFVVWLNRPKEKDDWHYLGVGLLLGAGTLARIDAWLTAGAFMAGIAYLVVTAGAHRPTRRQIGLLSAGFVPLAALGTIDLIVRSRPYFTALAGEFLLMVGVLSVAIVFMVAFSMITPGRLEKPSRFLRTAVPWLGVMILLAGLYGLLVRPYVSEPSLGHSIGHIAAIETREGLEVNGSRSYAEATLEWMARYQGHVPVMFGIGAASLAWFVFFRKKGDARVPMLVTLIGVGAVYFYRPSITPDQFWALRRFLPVVLPLAFVFTAWAARFILRRLAGRRWAQFSITGLLILALGQSVIVGWPVAAVRHEVGVAEQIREMCKTLPEDSVVLVDAAGWAVLPGAIRTECDLPVASLRDTDVVETIEKAGLVPIALATDQCGGDLGTLTLNYEFPERTVSTTPDGAEISSYTASVSHASEGRGGPAMVIPDSAEASIQVEVLADWVPEDGSSVIAALDDYQKGMWLEYQPTGAVELWVMTTSGGTGLVVTKAIDDGVEREIGGFLDDGTLYAFCGGSVTASSSVPGTTTFDTEDLAVNPIQDGDTGNLAFEGTIEVIPSDPSDTVGS